MARGLPALPLASTAQPHIGPTWLDLYRRRETLESGEAVVADEAYLTESMMDPRGARSWRASSR